MSLFLLLIKTCSLHWEGKPASWARPLRSVHMVSSGSVYASPSMLRFRDPNKFSSGNRSNCLSGCEPVLQDYPKRSEIHSFLSEGVNVKQFFVPFHGTFQGRHFSSNDPPSMAFPNSPSCGRFKDFISRTILERVSNGSLLVWGEAGKVNPPHLVMPIQWSLINHARVMTKGFLIAGLRTVHLR